jgi:hypothetical protein
MNKRQLAVTFVALIVVGVVARLVPHMPNFAPLTATALFCGVYMNRRLSLIAPLAVLLISDYALLYINPYGSTDFSRVYPLQSLWHSSLPYVYLSFGISAAVGWMLARGRSMGLTLAAAMFCSVQFFLITNAAVWIEGAYDRGIVGLYQSYVAGLPFFRGTLLGDLVYTATFFGAFELLRRGRTEPAASPVLTS